MATCPHCQAQYTPGPDQDFCDECGKTLSEAPAAADSPSDGPSLPSDVRNTVVGDDNVVGQTTGQGGQPADTPAPAPANVRNIVTGEGNIARPDGEHRRHRGVLRRR